MNKFGKVLVTLTVITFADAAINILLTRPAKTTPSTEDEPDPLADTPFGRKTLNKWLEDFHISTEKAQKHIDEATERAIKNFEEVQRRMNEITEQAIKDFEKSAKAYGYAPADKEADKNLASESPTPTT